MMLMGFARSKRGNNDQFLGYFENATDGTSFAFNGITFGNAHANRVLTVFVFTQNGSAVDISSVSIDGSTTGVIEHSSLPSGTSVVKHGAYSKAVASGATGNIVVTMGATTARCAILLFAHRRGTSPTVGTDNTISGGGVLGDALSLTLAAGGLLLMGTNAPSSSGVVFAFGSGAIIEDYDDVLAEVGTLRVAAGRCYTPAASTAATATHTDAGSLANGRFTALVFGAET